MTQMKSLEVDRDAGGKRRNPHSTGGGRSPPLSPMSNTARTYLMFAMALFVIYGVGKMMYPSQNSNDEYASKGDAAGGWGSEHNHPVRSKAATAPGAKSAWDTPVSHYHEGASSPRGGRGSNADLELRESDLLAVVSPLVFVPSHRRPEYERYQVAGRHGADDDGYGGGSADFSPTSSLSSHAEEILYDKGTPHGMAFDFLVNRDPRPIGDVNDVHLIQRFVLTLLFYATGGRDEGAPSGGRAGGWDSGVAHFLTGLHECHWVKKSLEDQFWGILSIEADGDRMVGVTKCNADMEVTEIRLADLNLVGFIPEEIKWLSSLESFDLQNNHLAGHLPASLGQLDGLRYLSLDGNNFSGTIPDVFRDLENLERAYLNFNDFNGAMPSSLCFLREEGVLKDLWSDCGGYPITCTCCTVCCDMVAECNEMDSQKGA